MLIALKFESIVFYLVTLFYFISIFIKNTSSYLAKVFCSEDGYMRYYNNNNNLNKRGFFGFSLDYYDSFSNEFHFHSSKRMDLTTIFLFIYNELKYGPLRFFLNKHSKFEVEVVFYSKGDIEKRFTLEYDFELESYVYNYKYNKLCEISNLFTKECTNIFNNFYYVDFYIKINN